jgi:hypothetical protein
VAAAGVAVYAFVTSYLLFRLIGLFLDLKVPMDARRAGTRLDGLQILTLMLLCTYARAYMRTSIHT